MQIQIFTPRFLLLIFFIMSYSFGITVFNENRKSTINRLFILMILSSSFDNLGDFLSTLLRTSWLSNAIFSFGDMTRLILPALYLHFSIVFPKQYSRIKKNIKNILIIYMIPAIIFLTVIYFDSMGLKLSARMRIVTIYQCVFLFSSMIILIEKLRENTGFPHLKKQILWVFFGFSTSFLIYSLTSFLSIYYNQPFDYAQYIFPAFLFAMLCPPVLGFNKEDIIYLLKRSFIYLIFISFLIVFYLFIYENIMLNWGNSLQYGYLLDILLIISITITFQPFQDKIYNYTGKILDKGWAHLEHEMLNISKNCVKIIEMELLVDIIQDKIKRLFNLDFVRVIIDEYGALNKTNPLFYKMLKRNDLIDLSSKKDLENDFLAKLEKGSNILISLKNIEGVFGYILLSEKKNKRTFSKRERFLLENLGVNISIALYNSLLFKKSEEMNERLSSMMLELNNKKKQLEKTDKMAIIGGMTANIAHQMKNPLGIIRLSIEEILERETKEDIKEIAENVNWESKRIEKHLTSLLAFAGEKSVVTQKIFLHAFFDNGINKMIPETIYPNIDISIDIDENIYILFDKDDLWEIISNIFSNAIDACEANGKITISTDILEDSRIGLNIFNNGKPISDRIIHQLFNPFFTTKKNGIGLGLSIVKQLLEKGEADIFVTPLNDGTKFTMSFVGGISET